MSEERIKILEMLKEGLIDIEQAEKLLKAVNDSQKEERKSEKKWRGPDFQNFTEEIGEMFESMQIGKFFDNVTNKIRSSISTGFNTVAGNYIDESINAEGIDQIQVKHSGGNVTFFGIDGQQFSIKCIRRTSNIREGVLTVNSVGGKISIGVPQNVKKAGVEISGGNATINNIHVEELKAETTGGDLLINDSSGSIKALAMGGSINITNVNSNDIQAKSINGKIQMVMGSLIDGKIELDSTADGVKLFVTEDSAFDLDAEIIDGKFESNLELEMIEDGPTQYKAKYNEGGASILIKTKHGDVKIAKK